MVIWVVSSFILKEETEQAPSWKQDSLLKAGLHPGADCGLGALCPVSMETTYQLEDQAPGRKSPGAPHRLKEYPNYLCNRIESYILLCLLGNDHKPIDNCPLLPRFKAYESWVNFGSIFLSPLFRLVSRNIIRRVYKVFTKAGRGPWLRGDSALGPPV